MTEWETHWPDSAQVKGCQVLYSVLVKRGSRRRKRRRDVAEGPAADAGGVNVSVVLCGWNGWSERSSREEAGEY